MFSSVNSTGQRDRAQHTPWKKPCLGQGVKGIEEVDEAGRGRGMQGCRASVRAGFCQKVTEEQSEGLKPEDAVSSWRSSVC